ncbi:beta-ketoacyl-[acyl-carrier-protein] synthase family protein [Sphingomonas sp. CGMCC 1.13654]|uniref:Nodulation protein E n=1 Tax=Sphingomonas chungangi TaxID=2683589 RepID=A0A838L9Z5_9SPHN|nr:beta-ketoacyl-[acyl-carrier-protein] synthase family protein [Sphingomonas chungangi]MBA2934328.1 beta-ketoacyl-[acyl-carrier-protein] synthase family protein [Sphingomonas chungangi]MVW57368.1 beta-ketoacyl-[acyl-carrier-protein] synthase family protein [Sphingomonas chungangi]
MSRRVAVTGMGCVSGLGRNVAETWRRIVAGDGAIRDFALPRGDGTSAVTTRGPAAPVDHIDTTRIDARFDPRTLGKLDPLVNFAVVAATEAVEQASLFGHPVLDNRTAVLLGCGSGGNATFEVGYRRLFEHGLDKAHPQTIPTGMISAPASRIAMLFGIHGPAMVLASACASSAHAIGEAMHMIRAGRVDAAIAGGSEACLTLGSWIAWSSLGAMAADTCRPFSIDRQGLVLGEGAAVFVLEEWEYAVARGATILGELAGYGASSDAAHITAPDRAGIERAIRAAHGDAGLPFDTPALISSHGTGTRLNDATEAEALRAVYGEALAADTVIATKSAHGHLIGASGALEFLLGLVALRERQAPPVLNHLGPDPACDVPLALAPRAIDHDWLVSNSFAFGGLNAVLIGRRV